jgi:hypothetical protein
MINRAATLFFCLALAACGGRTDDHATHEMEPGAAPMADADMAPDASNPTGNPELQVPPGWTARYDDGQERPLGADDSAEVYLVTMTPGWHVTTGPAGIYWHPASTASGAYSLRSVVHLFPPGNRNEGYGVFFGGSGLEGPDQAYLYFLLRRTGEFLVKRRMGEETEELIGWTASDAIVPYADTTQGSIRNELTVDVGAETVRFSVNGTEVASLPAAGLGTDGVVGLRVNHALNLHVEDLSVESSGM